MWRRVPRLLTIEQRADASSGAGVPDRKYALDLIRHRDSARRSVTGNLEDRPL